MLREEMLCAVRVGDTSVEHRAWSWVTDLQAQFEARRSTAREDLDVDVADLLDRVSAISDEIDDLRGSDRFATNPFEYIGRLARQGKEPVDELLDNEALAQLEAQVGRLVARYMEDRR